MGRKTVVGMKVERVKGKNKNAWGEGCEIKAKVGDLFGGSIHRYFCLSHFGYDHFTVVAQSLNSGSA